MKVTRIPAWALPAPPRQRNLWSVFACLDIEDQWVRLSPADQRALMGFAVFGTSTICVMEDGDVLIRRSARVGRLLVPRIYYPDQVRRAVARRQQVSLGASSPRALLTRMRRPRRL